MCVSLWFLEKVFWRCRGLSDLQYGHFQQILVCCVNALSIGELILEKRLITLRYIASNSDFQMRRNTYMCAYNSWPVFFTVSAWEWFYATNLSRLERDTSKRHVAEAHSVLTAAILLPQRPSCYCGKTVSLRMLINLRLTTAQQRTTSQNLPFDLYIERVVGLRGYGFTVRNTAYPGSSARDCVIRDSKNSRHSCHAEGPWQVFWDSEGTVPVGSAPYDKRSIHSVTVTCRGSSDLEETICETINDHPTAWDRLSTSWIFDKGDNNNRKSWTKLLSLCSEQQMCL
jgi:hypothetical protein